MPPRLRAAALRALCLACLFSLTACGRLGFSELDVSPTPLPDPDAGTIAYELPPLDPDARVHLPEPSFDAGAPVDAGEDVADAAPFSLPDAGPPPVPCTSCTPDSDACPPGFTTRLWPVASDVATCWDSFGRDAPTTGPGAADYTIFGGCSTRLDFDMTGVTELSLRTFGDGCECADCSLWHVHYQLQEDLGAGLTPLLEVQEPDAQACPGGHEVNNVTRYTPSSAQVRLQTLGGTTGAGFYYVMCAR